MKNIKIGDLVCLKNRKVKGHGIVVKIEDNLQRDYGFNIKSDDKLVRIYSYNEIKNYVRSLSSDPDTQLCLELAVNNTLLNRVKFDEIMKERRLVKPFYNHMVKIHWFENPGDYTDVSVNKAPEWYPIQIVGKVK